MFPTLIRIWHNDMTKKILSKLPFRLKFLRRSPHQVRDKFAIQRQSVDFQIQPNEQVLDIGSGGYPFPLATHLADLYENHTTHREETLVKDNRPFTKADIHNLPFADKQFDFVYCSHLLEHVDNPAKACEELMRVGKRGYIETPTKTSDIMFNFLYLEDHHKWHIEMLDNTLIFLPWRPEERKSTGTKFFKQEYHSRWLNPFQKLVMDNQHLFNNMFLWKERFNYQVFDLQGKIIASNVR